jgi:hypothetical protein
VALDIAFVFLTRLIRTTSFRLATIYLGIFSVSMAMLAGVVYFVVGEEIVREVDGRVAEETARFSSEFQESGLARLAEHIRARRAAGAVLDYWLEDSAGRSLAGGSLSLKAADGAYHEGWTTKLGKTEFKGGDAPDFSVERALVTKLGDGSFLVVGDELGGLEEARHAVLVAFGGRSRLRSLSAPAGAYS